MVISLELALSMRTPAFVPNRPVYIDKHVGMPVIENVLESIESSVSPHYFVHGTLQPVHCPI